MRSLDSHDPFLTFFPQRIDKAARLKAEEEAQTGKEDADEMAVYRKTYEDVILAAGEVPSSATT